MKDQNQDNKNIKKQGLWRPIVLIDAIWHPVTSKSFLDRKTLHALMAQYTFYKVCTNLFFRCTAEREWLGVNMSKICPEASINNTSIAF
jgi:hypothetical protein